MALSIISVTEPYLLIVWHSRTGASKAMAEAAYGGARENAMLVQAEQVQADDLLAAGGYLFICPENLASMSGAMKEMFDRCYYSVLGRIEGRPYATIIAAGSDGQGAQAQLDRIVKGWRLRRIADPIIENFAAQTPEEILAPKVVEYDRMERCRELGKAMAEGLAIGIY